MTILTLSKCLFAAHPVWVMRPQDTSLEEGKPGYLHCQAKASSEPEVTWLRGNLMITPAVTHTVYFSNRIPALVLCARFKQYKITTNISVLFSPQDARFKLFRNGTLRINNVEVYDGQMYSCETRTLAGQLSGHAQVSVLGELRGSLDHV